MKFQDLLQKVIAGLTSYYNDIGLRKSPEYETFLKMNECKNIQDLIDSMEAQGFGSPNEPLAWWILVFLVDEE